jgi:adenosine deaminase
MQDLLHKLPKVDLHLHLDGSVKPQTFLELALENQIKLPTYDIKELSSSKKDTARIMSN